MPARITNAANKTRAEEGTTTMNANKTRTTAANTIKETVVSTARKTTRKAATAATPTTKAQQERLAAGAKRAADKAVAEAEREALSISADDARTQARADKASAKAEAAKQRANELAEDAGLKLPFPAPRKRAARKPVATPVKTTVAAVAKSLDSKAPAKRTAAAKAADARGEAQSARSRKVEADKRAAKGRTGQFTPKPVDKRRKPTLTKFGSMLLAVIGSGQTSFFDDGIVKDSGIWHECLTGETAGSEGLPKTAAGVANVIDRLVEQGMLGKGEQDEDGVWVWLTEAGAREARNLAKSIFSVRNNDGKKVTGEPEVKPAKKAAAAKPTGMDAPKVAALVTFAQEQGWTVEHTVDGASVELRIVKDQEVFVVAFINGSMDASRMPYMLRSDGSKVLLRNVSAVKANLMTEADATAAGKASLRIKREVVRGARVRAVRGAADDQPRKRIPFNIELAEDDEVLDALAGRTITWRRTIDNGTLTATIGRKVWMGKANKPGKERVVHFIERVKGKRVNEGGQRSLRLDMLVSVD